MRSLSLSKSRSRKPKSSKHAVKKRERFPGCQLEMLEDRCVPSTIQFHGSLGVAQYEDNQNTTSLNIVTTADVEPGHSIIVELAYDSSDLTTPTATDSAGNTYTIDAQVLSDGQGASTKVNTAILSSHGVNFLAAGSTITLNFPANKIQSAIAQEFCGIDAVTPVDQVVTNTGTSSDTISSGLTGVTVQPHEVLIAALGVDGNIDAAAPNNGFTVDANFTTLGGTGTPTGNSGTKNNSIHGQYRIVTSTSQYEATGILNSNANGQWGMALVTYRADETASLGLTAPATVGSGTPFAVHVDALKADGITIETGYTGTISFTVTDTITGDVIPGDYTFTVADAGERSFYFELNKVGVHTITATDDCGNVMGSVDVDVLAPYFDVTAPASTITGQPFSMTVTARNVDGTVNTGYTGTIDFSTTDLGAGVVLPPSYTFLSGDNGVKVFNGVVLVTAGTQTIDVNDNVNIGIAGSADITVEKAPTSTLIVSSPNPSVYGDSVTFTATVISPYSSSLGTPTGTVTFFNGATVLQSGVPLDINGKATFSISTLDADSHNITAEYIGSDVYLGSSDTLTQEVDQRLLTVTATADNKVYDGTTDATATLSDNRLLGDDLIITFSDADFDTKNVGTGKPVTVTGISISGIDAANYTLASTTANTTADITPKTLTVSETASNKVYDGNTTATVSLSDDRVAGDVLTASFSDANFDTKNVGTNKTVTVTGISISGTDAANYTLASSTATTTADITARTLTVSATASNKVYDGNTTATVSLSDDRVAGDVVTVSFSDANFDTKNVGTNKTVTVTGISISGPDAGNYILASTTATDTADITSQVLTVSATASNKVYDGNTTATVSLSDDRVAGDVVTVSFAAANFSDPNVGTNKTVTVTGISISGTDAGNYTLASNTATTTADITPRVLTITATASNKVYDGTTTATASLSDDRISGDVLTVSFTAANFSDPNVGTGKTVTVSGITVTGTDAGNYTFSNTTTTTADITIAASTTTVIASANPITEGDPVVFTATVSPVAPGAGIPSGTIQFQVNSVNIGSPVTLVSGVADSDPITTIPVGTHTITAIYVNDDGNFQGSVGTLNNFVVNPKALSFRPVDGVDDNHNGVLCNEITFELIGPEEPPGQGFYTYDIDWDGDGTIDETLTNQPREILVTHTYEEVGTYFPRAIVTDETTNDVYHYSVHTDLAVDPPITMAAAAAIDGSIIVGGSAGPDNINVDASNPNNVIVRVNSVTITNPAGGPFVVDPVNGQVVIYGCSGDDVLQVSGQVNSELHGQEGRDYLYGGSGNDILLGGTGRHYLSGGSGDDVLIGGLGADRLYGDSGNDILVGGDSSRSNEELWTDLASWTTPGATSSVLGDLFASIYDPEGRDDYDRLAGGSGKDAHFYRNSGSRRDYISGFNASEDDELIEITNP